MADAALQKKLMIKDGHAVRLFNAPEGVAERIMSPAQASNGTADFVLLFATTQAQLAELAPQAIGSVKPGGQVWMAYPKKTSKIPSDLHRDVSWAALTDAGYRQVSLIAIDDTWSAIRFRPESEVKPREHAPAVPRDQRPELVVPGDLSALLDSHASAKAVFDKFSYSHRKEYIQWIEGAKRQETRERRLQKAVEMLAEGKALS